jgi:ABC-type spermidine/putrescine transport system permease subunit II
MAAAAERRGRHVGLALISPALAIVVAFFIVPLAISFALAFRAKDGSLTLQHFDKSFELYTTDLLFSLAIVLLSSALIAVLSIAIAGYLTLGENPRAVAVLRWLYRWPLFIPFVVAGQLMRTFLAKNGMLNHVLIGSGLIEPLQAQSLLDWRGIVVAFVWKQAPFVTLLVAGAMASLDRQHIEAARNLGAPRWRVLWDIVLPQVRGTVLVGVVLSFVTMLSVLSVPLMINPNSPTMVTVDVAYRINTHSDYAVANALCLLSLLVAAGGAWFYLRPRGEGRRNEAMTAAVAASKSVDAAAIRMPRRWPQTVLIAVLLALFAFAIFGPLANLLLWAFAEKWYFPSKLPSEYGLSFWVRVFNPRGDALASLGTSVWIAVLTVIVSLAVAIPAGYALARLKLPFRALILLLFLLPQAVPNMPIYVNIARVFYEIGLNGTVIGVVLVHAAHGLVLAVWIASASFAAVDASLDEAARNLGASPWTCFHTITLPLAAPGLMASAIFVFLESLDEFTGTFFVGVPDVTTLPLLMFNASQGGNYQIASITALLLLLPSIGFMLVVERFLKADVLAMVGR